MPAKRIVYILRSEPEPRRPYIGLTHDLEARLEAHNAGRYSLTARYRPWKVLVALHFADEPTAIRFERYLKSGSGRAFAKRHFEP
jgi:putative endonuclease